MPAEREASAADDSGRTFRALLLLLAVVFINIAGFSLILPLLPFYGQLFKAAPYEIAGLFAAYSLGNLLGETYWGRMSDRIGRRPVLVASIACSALCYVAFAFAPGLWTALALRVIGGFFAGNLSVIQGYIADITPPEQRAGRMGLFGASFNLGFVTGPAIGGLLARPELGAEGFRLPILVAAALSAAAAAWAYFLLPGTVRGAPQQRLSGGLTRREAIGLASAHAIIGPVIVISFITVGSFASIEAVFGLWTETHFGWGPRQVGLAFIAIGAAGFFTQVFLIRPLSRRFGEARVLMGGLAALILSMALQPLARDPAITVALMSLLMFGHSLVFPNATALISRASPPDAQGSVLGLNLAGNALARVIAPPILGLVYSGIGVDAPYFTCAALVGGAALIALNMIRSQTTARQVNSGAAS